MPRVVQITVPPRSTDRLIQRLTELPGLIGLRVQRGVSLHPAGDLISVEVTNRSLHPAMRLLASLDIGRSPDTSITTSEPVSVLSPPLDSAVRCDTSDATWEEMEQVIGKESNMTASGLVLMAIAGVLAVTGLATNAIHLVIGAMVIAPGFEPISRFSLGLASGGQCWRQGLSDTATGYAALLLGAGLATLALQALGKALPAGEASYLPSGVLVPYWTTITAPSLIASIVGSIGGALLIATNRSVLTAGVMIALALIPAASIIPMALLAGEMNLAGKALLRWGIEVALVAGLSALVFLQKRFQVQRRSMMP